jgi:RND family efflux transporter MFP subunit
MKPVAIGRTVIIAAVAFAAGVGGRSLWNRTGETYERGSSAVQTPNAASKPKTWYTCGMHPEVVQDHPGNCPKCGMKLQPMSPDRAAAMGLIKASEQSASQKRKILYWKSSMIPGEIHKEPGKDSMSMDLVPVYEDEVAAAGTIKIDPVTEQDMGVRVDKVMEGPLVRTVRTVGFVDYDETTLATVTTKVDGWIEKLDVNETGAQVHKGDPLFELYSPELFSAQQEYLAALGTVAKTKGVPSILGARFGSEGLVRDARQRLAYFDISPEQIAELERTHKARKTMTIRAPFTGIVTKKNVVEGQKIMAGMDIFRVADLSTVWVIAKVFEYDVPYVRLGQEALMKLSYLPGQTFRGRVTYVYPYLEAKTREVSVRMEFHNPGYQLKPGMYATVTLSTKIADRATLVPDVAVIDTGLRSVAFVMPEPGRFEAREVKVGLRSDNNHVQVLSGLAPGETVVVSGQFLLDSESRLREAALKLSAPGKVDGATPVKAETEAAGQGSEEQEGRLYYVCPMPEHSDILYDNPGNCPICGMKLVPVRRRANQVEKPKIAYWTCPMPEHSFIHEKGPGKCPICGMSLIPVTESTPADPFSSAETSAPPQHSSK